MYEDIISAMKKIDTEDDESLLNLAQLIRDNSWRNPSKLVDILHSDDDENSTKAAAILLDIDDLALTPILDSINFNNAEDLVWDMETVVDIQLKNRFRIVKILDKMLLDKRMLEQPEPSEEIEEEQVPRRVCDEAYIMMRRLFALEDEETELMNVDMFLDLPVEVQDAEIARIKKTKKWVSLIERAFEEEESEDDEFE